MWVLFIKRWGSRRTLQSNSQINAASALWWKSSDVSMSKLLSCSSGFSLKCGMECPDNGQCILPLLIINAPSFMHIFLCKEQCAKLGIYSACGQSGGGACRPRLCSAGAGEDHHHVLHSRLGGFAQEQTSRRLVIHVKFSVCLSQYVAVGFYIFAI